MQGASIDDNALVSVDHGDVVVLDLEGPAGIDGDRRDTGEGQVERQVRHVQPVLVRAERETMW